MKVSLKNGFRPLTGIVVLNIMKSLKSYQLPELSFRPLAGIKVLNSTPYGWLYYAIEKGICGADFIFCFFRNFL